MANELKYFSIERQGDVTIITPTVADFLGETTNFEAKRELIALARGENPQKVVIDFHNVERFSTEFIGVLLSFKRQLNPGPSGWREIKLCSLKSGFGFTFRTMEGSTPFVIVDTLTHALESLPESDTDNAR